jgi:hypothetical protein
MKKKRVEKETKDVRIEMSENPAYRAVYASGVFGGLDPNDGRVIFFLDRIKPKMRSEPKGAMDLEKINRELQVEIHMSPPQFASVAKWMMEHVQRFEKRVKEGKFKKADVESSPSSSYIG